MHSYFQDWERPTPPDADDKGFFNTTLPIILFQILEQNVRIRVIVKIIVVFIAPFPHLPKGLCDQFNSSPWG